MSDQRENKFLPVDVIFSCNVCYATFSDVYQNPEYDKGFRDDDHPEHDKQITKLWLITCGHVTCSKHLEGGGVPFHRAGEHPRASCPICTDENSDTSKKILYGIRGSEDGEHDPGIPQHWFDAPPINLDGKGQGMDALRFHYLALVRFGTRVLPRLRQAEVAAEEFKKQASSHSAESSKLAKDMELLKTRNMELEKCEKELKPWKEREPKIKHYLGLFPQITRENEKLREQLTVLGYAVPSRAYGSSLEPQLAPPAGEHGYEQSWNPSSPTRIQAPSNSVPLHSNKRTNDAGLETESDRTWSGPAGSAFNFHRPMQGQAPANGGRTMDEDNITQLPIRLTREDSQILMPPPPLPLTRNQQHEPEQDSAGTYQRPSAQEFYQNDSFPLANQSLDLMQQHATQTRDPGAPTSSYDHVQDLFRETRHGPTEGGHRFEYNPNKRKERDVSEMPFINQMSMATTDERNITNHAQSPAQQLPGLQKFTYNPRHQLERQVPVARRRQAFQAPLTSSPTRHPNAVYDTHSVASPFFGSRPSKLASRITLPQNTATKLPPIASEMFPRLNLTTQQHNYDTGRRRAPNIIYPPSKPYHPEMHQQTHPTPRKQLLVPYSRITSNGLFRRATALSSSEALEPPSSPYFQKPQYPTTAQQRETVPTTATYAPETPQATGLFKRREVQSQFHPSTVQLQDPRYLYATRRSDPYQPENWPTSHNGYPNRVSTRTGLKSGASRLSHEWAREAGYADVGRDVVRSKANRLPSAWQMNGNARR